LAVAAVSRIRDKGMIEKIYHALRCIGSDATFLSYLLTIEEGWNMNNYFKLITAYIFFFRFEIGGVVFII